MMSPSNNRKYGKPKEDVKTSDSSNESSDPEEKPEVDPFVELRSLDESQSSLLEVAKRKLSELNRNTRSGAGDNSASAMRSLDEVCNLIEAANQINSRAKRRLEDLEDQVNLGH
jgi:hypothetical protein